MSKTPAAYLRRSRVQDDRPGEKSHQEQVDAIKALAGPDAARIVWLEDWGKSGQGRSTSKRPGYAELRRMIESGRVSTLYSFSMSRLARSVHEMTDLLALCDAHGVRVRTASMDVDTTSATGRLQLNVMASIDQFQAELAREHSIAGVALARATGKRIGPLFYGERDGENLDAVLAAYASAGSVLGAAKLLNVQQIPTRYGRPWGTTPVREILLRLGAMPMRSRQGAKQAAPFFLYRLLRCHCGRTMTGSRYRNGSDPTYTTYRCIGGRTDIHHRRQSISESRLLPWVKEEAGRLRMPAARVETLERDETKRRGLEARRRRVVDNYEAGLIDKAERDAKVAAIADQIEALDATTRLVDLEPLDWTESTKTINGVLRAMWDHVQLDADLRPVQAHWLRSEWRRSAA